MVATAGITYLGIMLSLVSAPLIARTLGADGRGALAAAFIATQSLNVVSFLGLPRGLALDHVRGRPVSRVGIVVLALAGSIGGATIFLSAPLVASGQERVVIGARIAACFFPLLGFAQLGAQRLMASGRTGFYNLYRGGPVIVPSLVAIVAYPLGQLTFTVAYLATLLSMAGAYVVGAVFAIPVIRESVKQTPAPWQFSLGFWSTTALDSVSLRVDQLAAATLLTSRDLGVYAVAVTCANASGGLTQAMNQVAYSRLLAREARGSEPPPFNPRYNAIRLVVALVSALIVGGAISVIVRSAFGPSFSRLGLVTSILCVAQVFKDQWAGVFSSAVSAQTRPLALASGFALCCYAGYILLVHLTGMLSLGLIACGAVGFTLLRLTIGVVVQRLANARG